MDVTQVLTTFFLGTGAICQFFWAIPSLNDRMLKYGSRSSNAEPKAGATKPLDSKPSTHSDSGLYQRCLDFGSSLNVPHSWFTGFYVYSSLQSAVWGHQLYTRGPLFQFIASHTNYAGKPSMTFNQIVLVCTLFQVHGLRRLYESIIFAKPSEAKMNVIYFIIGIMYYTAMGISMWIEGIGALKSTSEPLGDARFSAPSLRTMVFLPLFILASGAQYDCHSYLASLKKYTFPEHPAFSKVLAPHYLAETCLYIALTFVAAPKGQVVNKSLAVATVMTLWNLALGADNTKTWSEEKFGKDKVKGKDRIIPYVY